VTGLFTDPGQAPADPPVAAKATARPAAAKPEVVSALTLPRPAHDITVSKDGRIIVEPSAPLTAACPGVTWVRLNLDTVEALPAEEVSPLKGLRPSESQAVRL
jgi:hypothetical protein